MKHGIKCQGREANMNFLEWSGIFFWGCIIICLLTFVFAKIPVDEDETETGVK